jgi:hypothetical protein
VSRPFTAEVVPILTGPTLAARAGAATAMAGLRLGQGRLRSSVLTSDEHGKPCANRLSGTPCRGASAMAIEKIPLSARCPQVARPGSADSRPGAATHHERGRLPSRSSQKPTASLVKSLGITVGHLSGRNSSVRFVECTHAAPAAPSGRSRRSRPRMVTAPQRLSTVHAGTRTLIGTTVPSTASRPQHRSRWRRAAHRRTR